MALNDRKRAILKAVVETYIETAEPVSSKAILTKYDFNLSAATIRNEMAELEELEFLVHPHTSAGRVPTDKGYREYVDNLITIPKISGVDHKQFENYFDGNIEEVKSLLETASSALSDNTGYTSLALTPRLKQSQLKQIKMLMIEPGRVLMVVVLEQGVVKDRLVRISDVLNDKQLAQVSNAIEQGLKGLPVEDITFVAVESAGKKTKLPETLLKQILYEAYVSIKQADNLDIYMEGSNKMLSYPEFNDINCARSFMDTLAQRGIVAGYLDEVNNQMETNEYFDSDNKTQSGISIPRSKKPYMIRIGQEISLSGFQNCSFVTTTYKLGEKVVGSIGVIGPKRMEYAKVISRIDFVRNIINDKIKNLTVNYK